MKKTIKSALLSVCLGLVFPAVSADNLGVSFDGVKFYEGGDGNYNTCDKNQILIIEFYSVANVATKGIVLARYSKNKDWLALRKPKYITKNDRRITFNYCVSPNYRDSIKARFITIDGEQSETLHFMVDTRNTEILNANQYPKHIKN